MYVEELPSVKTSHHFWAHYGSAYHCWSWGAPASVHSEWDWSNLEMKCKQQQQQHIELPFEVQGIACDVQKQGFTIHTFTGHIDTQYLPVPYSTIRWQCWTMSLFLLRMFWHIGTKVLKKTHTLALLRVMWHRASSTIRAPSNWSLPPSFFFYYSLIIFPLACFAVW